MTQTDRDALAARVLKRTIVDEGCLVWIGDTYPDGYPRISFHCKTRRLTRLVLEAKLNRPMLPGMYALHSCDRPRCVNPSHLREGTQSENIREAFTKGRKTPTDVNSAKTHCRHGHPFSSENTRRVGRERRCKTCEKAIKQRYRARQAHAACA
jgi:hypothetical protein